MQDRVDCFLPCKIAAIFSPLFHSLLHCSFRRDIKINLIFDFFNIYRLSDLTDLQNENIKLKNSIQQRDDKLLDVNNRLVFLFYFI